MELAKLTTIEIRKMSATDNKEAEDSVREELAKARLRAPLNKDGINLSQQRKLRRVLARLLTIRTQQRAQVEMVSERAQEAQLHDK